MVSVIEMYRRAQTGPVVSEKDFLIKTMLPRAEELAKEYGITRDPDDIIPTDTGLGDAVFKAAMVFLEERGLWCSNTSRVIKFTRKEIKDTLRRQPSKMQFGQGTDKITIMHRQSSDTTPAKKWLGPWGMGCTSPELFLKIHQSYVQESIDALQNGTLTHINGRRVRLGTPDEIYTAALGSRLLREAARRAGRPNIAINFDCQAMSDNAHPAILAPGGARPTDNWLLYNIYPTHIVKLTSLRRAAFSTIYGNPFMASGSGGPLFGYSGGPETSAIIAVAGMIGSGMLDGVWSFTARCGMRDVHGITNTRVSFWSGVASGLALMRNTDLITRGGVGTESGPCTKMSFYEATAVAIMDEVVRVAFFASAGSRSGAMDTGNGLFGRWVGEVVDAVAGISLPNAYDLLNILVSKIDTTHAPVGKRFQECYNMETLTPSKEYLDLYNEVKREIEDLGIAFK